jgi:hypothetical protein
MKKINTELPKVIINEQALSEAVKTLCSDIEHQSMNAISTLRKSFDNEISNDIESLKSFVNEGNFKAFLKDAETSYLGKKFLPSEERERVKTMFEELYSKNIDSIRTLNRIFDLPYSLTYDGSKITLDSAEVEKVIRKNFEIKLSETERTYFGLIADVVNSLNAMHDFETKHGYIEFSFNGINRLSRLGFFRKVMPMAFYKDFSEEKYMAALRGGTIGKDKDI